MKLIKFPSIEQFRNVIANVNRTSTFVGLDDIGEAVYDNNLKKPVIKFEGTIKLHGTNAGVSITENDFWAQSRENVITIQKDNAGFAAFAEFNKQVFIKLANKIAERNDINLSSNIVTIYGEWVGANIQKGVGVSNLPKSFFIFAVKITPIVDQNDEELVRLNPAYWVDYSDLRSPDNKIYNIKDYKTYEIEVDFNLPQLVQNKVIEMTIEVENECPVAKEFGFIGIGEGIVFTANYQGNRLIWKSKGEKHSSSKVKTLASVDVEKLNSIQEFINYAATKNRFDQAISIVFPNNEPIDIKKLGDVIRWVVNDVVKEEFDTMMKNGIEPKEVNSGISKRVKEMFMELPV